jgi:hypothetical protein
VLAVLFGGIEDLVLILEEFPQPVIRVRLDPWQVGLTYRPWERFIGDGEKLARTRTFDRAHSPQAVVVGRGLAEFLSPLKGLSR